MTRNPVLCVVKFQVMSVVYCMMPVTQTIRVTLNSRMTLNKEIERVWEEMVIPYFKALFRHLCGGIE